MFGDTLLSVELVIGEMGFADLVWVVVFLLERSGMVMRERPRMAMMMGMVRVTNEPRLGMCAFMNIIMIFLSL